MPIQSIKVYYTQLAETPDARRMEELLRTIPYELIKNIGYYKQKLEQYRRLVGKLLLIKLLNDNYPGNNISLYTLHVNAFGAYFYQIENDCNISYSGDVIICAHGEMMRTGIDIEFVRDLDIDIFRDYFCQNEWNNIKNDANPLNSFFRYWVRKEAFLKATGRGVLETLDKFDVSMQVVVHNNTSYYLQDLPLAHYASAIATDKPTGKIELVKTDITELIKHDT